MIAMILIRNLCRDITRYNRVPTEEERAEERSVVVVVVVVVVVLVVVVVGVSLPSPLTLLLLLLLLSPPNAIQCNAGKNPDGNWSMPMSSALLPTTRCSSVSLLARGLN